MLLNPIAKSFAMCKKCAYLRLFRIEHALLLALAVLLSELLSSKFLGIPLPSGPIIFVSLLVPIFIEMASFALNDYYDVASDRANKRMDRPLVTGELTPKNAISAATICYALGLACTLPLPATASAIALIFAALSVAYNFKLKDLPLVGNAYIAASMSIPFLFGNYIVSGTLLLPVLLIAIVAFFAGFGREILKSTEDVKGDVLHRKSKTLPALVGAKQSARLAAACYLLLVPLCLLPFAYGLPPTLPSGVLVGLTALLFAYMALSCANDAGKKNLTRLRKLSLAALAVGLLGYAASLI